jgi:pimeloyl-ACP methyl ester carboxylesterase
MSGIMTERAPIHLGSGEPILLLHPFMMSQNVWKNVAPLIAETGRYEVFAPTMPGHNAGSTRWAGIPRTSSATRSAAGSPSSWSAAAGPAR